VASGRCNLRGSLPFCYVTLCAKKQKDQAYPAELKTIGDHLRTRRLDLGLLQRELAEQIGVTKCTIQYWETNRVSPAIRFRPRITQFLGYEEWCGSFPESLAERLRIHRMRLGLSRRRLAVLLKIDESSLANWETGKRHPTGKCLKIIKTFLCDNTLRLANPG